MRAVLGIQAAGGSLRMSELDKLVSKDEVPIAIGWLRRQNLVRMEKSDGETVITLTEQGRSFLGAEMKDEKVLRTLMAGDRPEAELPQAVLLQLKGRQDLIVERQVATSPTWTCSARAPSSDRLTRSKGLARWNTSRPTPAPHRR